MKLIGVLLALLLDRALVVHREGAPAGWFARYVEWMVARLPAAWQGTGAALALVLPPAVAVALVQWAVAPWAFGLVALVVGVAFLVLALGPVPVADLTDDYVEARRRDDLERSSWFYERLTGEAPPASPVDEGRRASGAILHQVHDNLFAPIFWFCVLGPAGAVGYRAAIQGALLPPAALAERPGLLRAVRFVAGLLGWIPARLAAFGYAMTGSFDEALGRLRAQDRTHDDLLTANRQLLAESGAAALRHDDEGLETAEPAPGERRSTAPGERASAAWGLAMRTGVFWLAVLALLTLAGWLG